MPELDFSGPDALKLDDQGRLIMPARHVAMLRECGIDELVVTRARSRALLIFPPAAWADFRTALSNLTMEDSDWRRLFLGNKVEVKIDKAARFLISPALRKSAGLDRDVVLLGVGSHLELWDAQRHADYEEALESKPLPPGIGNLVI